MKILGVDFGYGSGKNKDVISLVGIEKTNEKCEVISCETRYINWDVIEMTDYIDDKFNGYNYITINSTGIGMSLIDNLKQNLKYKNKIIECSVCNIERTHNLITRLHDSKLNERLGLDIPIKMICGRLKFDFENKSIIESTTLLALSLANYAFYNIPEPLEFNRGNIKDIAEESFDETNWNSYTLKQFSDTEVIIRKNMDRNTFIDYVVQGCVDEKVVHLTREWHRGIAKTYFIKNMAEKFNLPIFVKYKSPEYNNNKVYTNIDQLIGVRFNKILVDECDKETVAKLRKMGIAPIGFACTYQNYELI